MLKNMILKMVERVDRMEKTVDIRIGKYDQQSQLQVNNLLQNNPLKKHTILN